MIALVCRLKHLTGSRKQPFRPTIGWFILELQPDLCTPESPLYIFPVLAQAMRLPGQTNWRPPSHRIASFWTRKTRRGQTLRRMIAKRFKQPPQDF